MNKSLKVFNRQLAGTKKRRGSKKTNSNNIRMKQTTYPKVRGATLSRKSKKSNSLNDFFQRFNIPEGTITINNKTLTLDQTRYLKSVTIPTSVVEIGVAAFKGCGALKKVNIPISVKSIGNYAFERCTSLVEVKIPNSVKSLGVDAFSNCVILKKVNIPTSVESIGDGAFVNCKALVDITIPDSVESIGDYTFFSCERLKEVTIPTSVNSIGDHAFSKCRALKEVIIPTSVESIKNSAFKDCLSLKNVTISTSVKTIGEDAFNKCHRDLTFTTTMEYFLPEDAGSFTIQCVYDVTAVEQWQDIDFNNPETRPGKWTIIGSETPPFVLLQDLGGNEYRIYDCWSTDGTETDLKKLAAQQYPDYLRVKNSYQLLLHNKTVATDTLDLGEVANMAVRGELNLNKPILIVWNDVEG